MQSIDLSKVEVANYSPLPEGTYSVQVQKAELKKTKDGTGAYIEAECNVVGEDYKGRKVWARYNVVNKNPKAVEIGYQQLKQMIVASGTNKTMINDPADIVGLEFNVYLTIKETEYSDTNEIRKYGKANETLKYKARVQKVDNVTAAPVQEIDCPF